MGKWKDAFNENLPALKDREYGERFAFGRPATLKQLAACEARLGAALPDDLRELLREFNGVRYTTDVDRKQGYEASPLYLDTDQIAGVFDLLVDTGNDLPPLDDLKRVAFFWQSNGYGEVYGVCLAPVAGLRTGTVVKLDHENDRLERAYPNLLAFVRKHRKGP